MKTHTVYVEIPCSENPKTSGIYQTNLGQLYYSNNIWSTVKNSIHVIPNWWLEKREDQVVMGIDKFVESIENAFVAGDQRGIGENPFNCEQYFTQTFGCKS